MSKKLFYSLPIIGALLFFQNCGQPLRSSQLGSQVLTSTSADANPTVICEYCSDTNPGTIGKVILQVNPDVNIDPEKIEAIDVIVRDINNRELYRIMWRYQGQAIESNVFELPLPYGNSHQAEVTLVTIDSRTAQASLMQTYLGTAVFNLQSSSQHMQVTIIQLAP